MNIYQKLAVTTAATALGLAGISVNSVQAASLSLSFTVGDFLNYQSGLTRGTLSGSFSGTDINGDGFLERNEIETFNMNYSGDAVIGTQAWDLSNLNMFSYLIVNSPLRLSLNTTANNNGATAALSFEEGASSTVATPSSFAISHSFPGLTTSVPEPDNIEAVFASGTILGLNLLLKKKVARSPKGSMVAKRLL